MGQRIKLRRDTSANWASNNPVLQAGEFGWETNTNKLKIGDGVTAWNALPYFGIGSGLVEGVNAIINAWAINSVVTANHGLGSVPKFIDVYLECVTANNGYAIGDRFYPQLSVLITWWASATQVGIVCGASTGTIRPKAGGANVSITGAQWKVVARPFA
jgi:Major tropism determinant N-terminal domain